MTDLEQRLRDGFARAADDAPRDRGLASAARQRARRRRDRVVGGVAGLGAVALLVPAGLFLGDRPSGGGLVTDPRPPSASDEGRAVPDGWREEQWQGISVLVPDDWRQGARNAWCGGGGSASDPLVQRPGQPARGVRCRAPQISMGLSFGSSAVFDPVYDSGHVWRYERGAVEVYTDGSWLGYWYDADHLVQVNAADRRTVEQVLGSLVEVDDGWTDVEHEGVTLLIPPGWSELDTGGCANTWRQYGPPDDPCGDGLGIAFYASALFDPAIPLGMSRTEDGWGALAYVGDWAIVVRADDRGTVERVLDSAR